MPRMKPLSRRTFLKGAGNVAIALPFLDAMIPTFARAATGPTYRYVPIYYGSCNGGERLTNPDTTGALTAPLKASIKSLEDIKQHITVLSKINLPQKNNDTAGPGEAELAQHKKVEGPIFTGMRSYATIDRRFMRGTTADQYAAMALGSGSKFKSLEVFLQAHAYNNKVAQHDRKSISAIEENGVVNELPRIVEPIDLYNKLFSSSTPNPGTNPSSLLARGKSILDFIMEDANRLTSKLSGEDKARMDLHFTKIRELEKSIAAGTPSTNGGGGTCTIPNSPGSFAAATSTHFGGWADETERGEVQAELIAYAIACDLTRVISWQLTDGQTWLGSKNIVAPGQTSFEIHHDSHNATNEVRAANHNWGVNHLGLLVKKLSQMSDAHGTLLDHTFLSYVTAEGSHAHNRSQMTYYVAGCPHKIKNGVHINTNDTHPAKVFISGFEAVGMNKGTLGEVSGTVPGLKV